MEETITLANKEIKTQPPEEIEAWIDLLTKTQESYVKLQKLLMEQERNNNGKIL